MSLYCTWQNFMKGQRGKLLLLDFSNLIDMQSRYIQHDIIHLWPSLEGGMKICSTQKIHVARGRHKFSGLNKFSCLPTNLAINCYTKSWNTMLHGVERCAVRHDYESSGGRREDLSPAPVTSLDQSYFFICRINYMSCNRSYLCSQIKLSESGTGMLKKSETLSRLVADFEKSIAAIGGDMENTEDMDDCNISDLLLWWYDYKIYGSMKNGTCIVCAMH